MNCEHYMWDVEETCNNLLLNAKHSSKCTDTCSDTCEIYLINYARTVFDSYPDQKIQPVARCYYEPICQTCVDYIHGKVQ